VKFEPEITTHLPVCATTSTSDGGDSDVDGGSFDVTAVAAADEAGKESSGHWGFIMIKGNVDDYYCGVSLHHTRDITTQIKVLLTLTQV
jgi:hypothetical protein